MMEQCIECGENLKEIAKNEKTVYYCKVCKKCYKKLEVGIIVPLMRN